MLVSIEVTSVSSAWTLKSDRRYQWRGVPVVLANFSTGGRGAGACATSVAHGDKGVVEA